MIDDQLQDAPSRGRNDSSALLTPSTEGTMGKDATGSLADAKTDFPRGIVWSKFV